MTKAEAIKCAIARLASGHVENASQEGRWFVEEISARRQQKGGMISEECWGQIDLLLHRRIAGEPLQYLLGNVDFYDIRLLVGPGVLIPRPETEELVELALSTLKSPGVGCDVCTGSGAIGLSLAHAFPKCTVYCSDISDDALVWARQNLNLLKLTNAQVVQGDLFDALPAGTKCDFITANPPYVSPCEYQNLERVVKDFEPRLALEAADDGFAIITRIADEARAYLNDNAWIFCEIGDEQGALTRDIFAKCGYSKVQINRDLSGHDRILSAQYIKK